MFGKLFGENRDYKKQEKTEVNEKSKFHAEDYVAYSDSGRIAVLSTANVEEGGTYELTIFNGFMRLIEKLIKEKFKVLHSSGVFEEGTLEIIFYKEGD
ncbi:hypothetical protein GOV13_02760 [Candidatus Pacearchaeota archaeon]|nr:hypothetical protein [Candidatus Pacearchaeota archaeon]